MLRRALNKLEDPENPLLGPNIKALKFWGIILPQNKSKKYFCYFLNTIMLSFIISQYIDVWLVRSDTKALLNNLKTSMVSPVNIFKVTTFYIWQNKWLDIFNYISRADLMQRRSVDRENIKIISDNTKYCRTVTRVFWSLVYFTGVLIITTPMIKYAVSKTDRMNIKNGTDYYVEIVRCWVPVDTKHLQGYVIASIYQIYIVVMATGYIASFDTNAISMMMFFKTEIMTLENDSSQIFGTAQRSLDDETIRSNIKECHRRRNELFKYTDLFNSCISPIMFFYVVVCSSIMLCAVAYESTIETNIMSLFVTVEFLAFGVTQLFMYCWHSNEVMVASRKLLMGPYRSVWWGRSKQRQRDLTILVAQFDKQITFSAGPFTDLTMATFVNIVKGAYSYYTLIK